MTQQEKREREEFYETVMAAVGIMASDWGGDSCLNPFAVQEVLPMYADAGSWEERLVRGILLGETDEPLDEETAERLYVGAADAEETKKLYKAIQNMKDDEDWEEKMWDFGWHCLEWLDVIWMEHLQFEE